MSTQFKVCNCNRSMPLDAAAGAKLGAALGGVPLPVASGLCRHDAGACQAALQGSEPVVVGCTQERARFAELAQPTPAPIRFVNLRETGGWGAEAHLALPKMAALLAAAALPDPEPVPAVNYVSHGRLLIIGAADQALPWARRLVAQLEVNVLLTAGSSDELLQERTFPVFSGRRILVSGWLGAFQVRWQQANPIDLETCVRCNACIDACPENAIDLTYQIDLDQCRAHRDCVSACGAIGAIDFARNVVAAQREAQCDLIFDLSATPLVAAQQPPQGYFAPGESVAQQFEAAFKLLQMTGEFEKPQFFAYKERLCAHGRNGKTGCSACIDICSAEAIRADGDRVRVEPHLCAGCGACSTVCPSGAMRYRCPSASDTGTRFKTLLTTYAKAGGRQAGLLLHDKEQGAVLIGQLGRLARAGGHGVPARIIPVEVQHTASIGIELWLAAVAYGAANLALLVSGDEAPQYLEALEQQMAVAQAILSGLGYAGCHFQLIRAGNAAELDSALAQLQPAQAPEQAALYNVAADKRNALDFALGHLLQQAPQKAERIALPAGAPYGAVVVDRDACTLCMSCVGACPASALIDNPALPQLRFIEKNCVQCGLCQTTCPEAAITLTPRLLLGPAASQPVVLSETQPFHCIRCHQPFGALMMIENMLSRLAAHSAFAANLERLRMCADCRVVDMLENQSEASILQTRRPR
jgi:ferredoxin